MHKYAYLIHIYAYYTCYLPCFLPPQPPYEGGQRPPPVVESFMEAGEAAKIANICINTHKYALNAQIDAYISYIPLFAHYGSS